MLINKYLSRCIHIDSYPYESVRIYKHKCNTNTDWPLANISEYLWRTPMNIRLFQLGVLSTNTYGCKWGWNPPTNLGNALTSQYKCLCEYSPSLLPKLKTLSIIILKVLFLPLSSKKVYSVIFENSRSVAFSFIGPQKKTLVKENL